MVEWIGKLDTHPAECYRAMRMNFLQLCARIWTNLRNTILKREEHTVLCLVLLIQYYVCEIPFV